MDPYASFREGIDLTSSFESFKSMDWQGFELNPYAGILEGEYVFTSDNEGISEGESGRPNQDGQIAAAGTFVAEETEHQETHDQADEARPSSISPEATTQIPKSSISRVSKKRRETPPDDKGKKKIKQSSTSEGESSRSNQDGKIAAGELIPDEVAQKSTSSCVGKQEGGPPLTDKEKKEKHNRACRKSRNKKRKEAEDTKKELQETKKEVEGLKKTEASLNEDREEMLKKFQDSDTENGKLQQEISRLKETISDLQRSLDTMSIWLDQTNVMKMKEELQVLKTKCNQLESQNVALMAEKEMMTNNLLIAASDIEALQLRIYSLNNTIAQLQQSVNMFSNGRNQELLMDQGQLGSIIGTSASQIQSMHSEMSQQFENWKREAEEERNDRAEAKKQMFEVLAEMRAVKEIMVSFMKSGNR